MEQFYIKPASDNSRRGALFFAAGMATLAVVLPFFRMAAALPGLLLGMLAMAFLVRGMRRATCLLTSHVLTIRGDLWGRRIPRSALLTADARIVSLRDEPQFQPTLRTFGTAWPGYLSGWFRLRNKAKAFIVVTEQDKVVYLPTTQGYVLLLSLEQPDEFLRALREGQ